MAISYVASSLNIGGDQGSVQVNVSWPTAVPTTNRQIAILQAVVKDSSAQFTDPPGWRKIGEQAGGTGAAADDLGTTKVAAWYRMLDGTELIFVDVVVANDVGVSSAGGIFMYAPSDGSSFAGPIFVSGSDDTHGADFNPTGFAAWDEAIQPGDFILAVAALDTDGLGAFSNQTLAQTGIVFSTNHSQWGRVVSRSTTGFDCGLHSYAWPVISGSNTNAPTYSHNTTTESCGPMMLIRLHEDEVIGSATFGRQTIVGP